MPDASRAGQLAETSDLVDLPALLTAYYSLKPDVSAVSQQVAFGTSGHRGSSLNVSFNENHILAIVQAVCEYRSAQGISGPLFLGKDTHGLSEPAWANALEVLAANDVTVVIDQADRYSPTPAISHAILAHNRTLAENAAQRADGIIITPSHNPPRDGGIKYNPPHGGPADTDATRWIAERANTLLGQDLDGVRRVTLSQALNAETTHRQDIMSAYVDDLASVIDIAAIRSAGLQIAVDPLGGAAVDYWALVAERHQLDIHVTNPIVDATWRFMTLDWDGKIRMDCSSPSAMASLIGSKDDYVLSLGNDADADRHGIVTRDAGLMNPNHYLSVAIDYLLSHRPQWGADLAIGKTAVSSSMIDRVVQAGGRNLWEVPVGFKWFVPGLLAGTVGFGGEESAGASLLRHDGTVWTTDKDGIALGLLAAEITAVTGKTPSQLYGELTAKFGQPAYARIDAAANREQKARLSKLSASDITATELAGEAITAVLTEAPGNSAGLGGVKVCTEQAWFAARPSGTEDVYKIYAESFAGHEHLQQVQAAAADVVNAALNT